MGYVYLLCVALMFSFGGTCVKLISPYFNASWITFFRFFIGVVWLLILKCILRQPFQKNLKQALLSCWKWILFRSLYQMDGLSDRKLRLKPRTFLWKYCDPACPDPVSDAGKRTVL